MTVNIPLDGSPAPRSRLDIESGGSGIGNILCLILYGKTVEELAMEIIEKMKEEEDGESVEGEAK